MLRAIAVASAVFALSASSAFSQAVPASIAAAVSDPGRPEADQARDINRKPGEMLAFAGVKPGMVIGELAPGRGYYTRILAKAVGPGGKVYALASKGQAARPGGLDALNAIAAANPNVVVMPVDYTDMKLPEKADLIWTTENYHDFHNGPTANIAALNKSVYDSLKPGAIFFVEDHNAKAGSPADVTSTLHRIEEATAKRELLAAGFKLDAESSTLRNPADSGDKPNSDGDVKGRTDRFALRFERP